MNRAPGTRPPYPSDDGINPMMSRRMYLTVRVMMAGAQWPAAMEAVSSVAIEHADWDMDERRTWDDWEHVHR